MQNDVMWIEVSLKTSFFQPEKLEKGMWFLNLLHPGTSRQLVELWELDEDISDEQYDEFVRKNGFPVELLLTMEMANPDEPDDLIAFNDDIAWFYDVDSQEMSILDLKKANKIIDEYGGKVFLLIDEVSYDADRSVIPELEGGNVIITYPFEEDEMDEEEDDTEDYGLW